MIDCFWCGEEYDAEKLERCPKCSTDIDTKSIPIIRASGEGCGCGSCGCKK